MGERDKTPQRRTPVTDVDSTPSPGSGAQFAHFQFEGRNRDSLPKQAEGKGNTVIYGTEAWQGGPTAKTAGGSGSILGRGTRFHMLQLKISYATTETQHNQIK